MTRGVGTLLIGMMACIICGCSGKKDTATAPAKETTEKTTSVSTPPLELATTTEATGMQQPPAPAAGTKPADTVAFTPTEVKANTNIMILFDASGSMSGPIEADSKMAYVKSAMKDLMVQPAPGTTKRVLGLRAFGSTHPIEQQQCEDSALIAPLGQMAAEKIGPAINAIEARGMSPVAYALQQAAGDLPPAKDDTDNMIILLADGEDTCAADPCLAAEQIHAGPSRAVIHVVGFDLNQPAEQQLRCVAQKGDGKFFLARNVAELRSAADQALNANLPYNLRVKVFAGATPLATEMTVYRSGTRQVVEQSRAPGIKFLQLQPGTYDILISYADSVQDPKPSKLLQGVEVQASARAEQVVNFDLGVIELSGIAPYGQPVALTYQLSKPGDTKPLASITGTIEPMKVALTPGEYVVTATGPAVNEIPLIATSDPLAVVTGQQIEHIFQFETGELFLRAQNSRRVFIPAHYRLALANNPEKILTEGEITPDGKMIPLPVGEYVIHVEPAQGLLQTGDPVRLEQVRVPARDRVQELVSFDVGSLQLIGKDSDGSAVKTEFVIRRSKRDDVLLRETTEAAAFTTSLAPGLYQITAVRLGGKITPAPTLVWEDVEIAGNATVNKEATFQLGTLQFITKDAKGDPLQAEITLFRPGVEEPLATQRTGADPVSFQLTPGLYDIRAQDMSAAGDVKPTVWLHDVPVTANGTTSKEFIFTSGRVRLTCRGTNDSPIACTFKLFTYGQDAPLFSGATEEKWREFEMKPGYYYMEVAYDDTDQDYVLKKWINISVAENETVEEVIRF